MPLSMRHGQVFENWSIVKVELLALAGRMAFWEQRGIIREPYFASFS
jgi:hypothetical protein